MRGNRVHFPLRLLQRDTCGPYKLRVILTWRVREIKRIIYRTLSVNYAVYKLPYS